MRAAALALAMVACAEAEPDRPRGSICRDAPDSCGIGARVDRVEVECVAEGTGYALRIRVEVDGWTGGESSVTIWPAGGGSFERHRLCTTEVLDEGGDWSETLEARLVPGECVGCSACDVKDLPRECPFHSADGSVEVEPAYSAVPFPCPADAWDDELTLGIAVSESNGDFGRGGHCVVEGAFLDPDTQLLPDGELFGDDTDCTPCVWESP